MQTANVRVLPRAGTNGSSPHHHDAATGAAHIVRFYENDHFLSAAVADFLADGLSAGQPVVAIATEVHRDAFSMRLRSRGIDVEAASRAGLVTLLDAREILATFMVGTTPDRERFRATIVPVIERSARAGTHSVVRAYGEMVDLLWEDGNTEGAIRLEDLWNDLASTHTFSLLCAYAMGNFYRESHGADFEQICRVHEHVIPTEQFIEATPGPESVEVSILQQRAIALETEIIHRVELERRLRDALAARTRAEDEMRHALAGEQAARAEAEAANRAKSEFLAVMSHELRTPLNAIGGHVQLVELGIHGPVTDAQRNALDRVQRSQRHLLTLINDVLNLVRIETGHVEFVTEDIALGPFLDDVMSTVEPLVDARELECIIATPVEADVVIRADREKVQQILLNLLTNAIKFTAPGGRVTIAVDFNAASSEVIGISVTDTGIGIPASKLDSIFEPFVQLGRARISAQEGVGLGLAISRDLAIGMGGTLSAASTVGKGSTFLLTLPRA